MVQAPTTINRPTTTVYKVVLAGVLTSLTVLLSYVPSIGFIPVPSPAGNATTLHIPAIVGGILGGPLVGLLVGLTFGLMSFLRSTLPLFKDPTVAILPRLFIGVVAWAAYAGAMRANRTTLQWIAVLVTFLGAWFAWQVHSTRPLLGWVVLAAVLLTGAGLLFLVRRGQPETVAVTIAAVLGSFTNTALVLGMAAVLGYLPAQGVFLVGTTHGIPEAIVAAIIAVAVVSAVRGTGGRQGSSL